MCLILHHKLLHDSVMSSLNASIKLFLFALNILITFGSICLECLVRFRFSRQYKDVNRVQAVRGTHSSPYSIWSGLSSIRSPENISKALAILSIFFIKMPLSFHIKFMSSRKSFIHRLEQLSSIRKNENCWYV